MHEQNKFSIYSHVIMKFFEKWVLVPLFIDSWNLVLPELILQMLNYQHLHVIIYGGQAIPWKSAMNKNRYHTTHLMNYRISRSPNWLDMVLEHFSYWGCILPLGKGLTSDRRWWCDEWGLDRLSGLLVNQGQVSGGF